MAVINGVDWDPDNGIDWEELEDWQEGLQATFEEEKARRAAIARKILIYLGVPLILRGIIK